MAAMDHRMRDGHSKADGNTEINPIPRAGTDGAHSSDIFKPGADPDAWIDQHAAAYQERPEAVLRELLQNAVDSLHDIDLLARFIEVAILSQEVHPEPGQYHIVVRDAGIGMAEDILKSALGILGSTTKFDKRFIGEFGVGFYSTHAICFEVVVVSKAADSSLTAWEYIPKEKTFYRLADDKLDGLLQQDFENHPRPARVRSQGTSVYLRLDVQRFPQCQSWLKPADLAVQLRRDGRLLPSRLYVADYSDNPNGNKIYDFRNRDLSEGSLSLVAAPWKVKGADLDELLPRLFEQLLPYTEPADFPHDWFSFHVPVEDGFVSGLLYLVAPKTTGYIDLYLKGMHVETAQDLVPMCAYPAFGLVDITPGSQFDATVLAARDHVVRNDSYMKVCVTVEDACLDLFETRGKLLLSELARTAQNASGTSGFFHDFHTRLSESTTYRVLCSLNTMYHHLLENVPEILNRLITATACPEALRSAVLRFARGSASARVPVSQENLSTVLQSMQASADESHDDERAIQSASRTMLSWNPRVTMRFFEKVGPYLPFMVHRRQQQPSGQVGFQTERVPLTAVKLLDQQSATVLKVLTNGSPTDYLVRNTNVSLIVQPQSDADLIALCIVREMCFPELKLDFVTFERDLFNYMATRDEWTPLVNLLEQIVSHNEATDAPDSVSVDARGYNPDYVPLLEHTEEGKRILVINGYNDLMHALKDGYRLALERNDAEVVEIDSLILHELLHHASPAAVAARPPEERHVLSARTELFRAVLSMVQKYTDFKLRQ